MTSVSSFSAPSWMTFVTLSFSYYHRHACGIPDDDDNYYIITGGDIDGSIMNGESMLTKVSKYSGQGWIEDLPKLHDGRTSHGCGTYVDSNNNRVNILF